MLGGNRTVSKFLLNLINRIHGQKIIFFIRDDRLSSLNKAAVYVMENEQTTSVHVINCYEREEDIPPRLAEELKLSTTFTQN